MVISADKAFEKMDALSLQGKSFFFMVDFLVENAVVVEEKDFGNEEIQFSFPNSNLSCSQVVSDAPFELLAFPEGIATYEKGFRHIQENLYLGNSYLANYTCKTPIQTSWSIQEIFKYSQAKYKIKFRDDFVCFSPETFIEIKENRIATHPMKGTIDATLPNAEYILKNDEKEKAEHYTVVDLLRNDLSQVAQKVRVKEFQRIDSIKTHREELLGMSSEIEGMVKKNYQNKVGTILKTLLPAGSILGAPKPKTLEIILESERFPRRWYTGVAGYFDGKNLDSCVMIRFVEKENDQFFFRSGGGITHKSNVHDEYQEMRNKIYIPKAF